MFSDTNLVVLMGNLAYDPELNHFGDKNTPFCKVTVISNYRKQTHKEVTFQDIVTYGNTATLLAAEGRKGKKVQVTGRLRTHTTDKEGQKISWNEVVVTDLKFLGSPPEKGNSDEYT